MTETANITLVIDADNATPDRFGNVLTILARLGVVNVCRAYGNYAKPGLN